KRTGSSRHINVVFLRVLREWRQDADHRVRFVVHAENFGDDGGVAAETTQPVFVTQQEDGRRVLLFIFRGEVASKERLGAENIEEIPGHYAGLDLLRLGSAEQNELHVVILDDGIEAAILRSIVVEFGNGDALSSRAIAEKALAQHQDPFAILVGQRLEQHRVDDAKDRSVRAYAQAKDYDRGDCETEIFAHHAHR